MNWSQIRHWLQIGPQTGLVSINLEDWLDKERKPRIIVTSEVLILAKGGSKLYIHLCL